MNVRPGLGLIVLCLSALALAAPAVLAEEPSPGIGQEQPSPASVLYIGNSHTERDGGLGWLVGNFVTAEGTDRPYRSTQLTEGGVNLEYHWTHGGPELIESGDFDAVVLQGYLAAADPGTTEPFLEYARRFDDAIRASGAETVFFMTWPGEVDDWSTIDDVVEAHRQIAQVTGASVAPAALAFEKAMVQRPDLVLIGPDRIHATWTGAYLAAATVYATLFERSPEGLEYAFGLDADTAAFLQRVAWETVTEWNEGLAS